MQRKARFRILLLAPTHIGNGAPAIRPRAGPRLDVRADGPSGPRRSVSASASPLTCRRAAPSGGAIAATARPRSGRAAGRAGASPPSGASSLSRQVDGKSARWRCARRAGTALVAPDAAAEEGGPGRGALHDPGPGQLPDAAAEPPRSWRKRPSDQRAVTMATAAKMTPGTLAQTRGQSFRVLKAP